jgi:O-antigen/teichoic acid export membrane protein
MKFAFPLQFDVFRHWKDPLYRNSFFLILSFVVNATFGFIFWMIAARFYSNENIGIASALISSMGLLVLLSGFGLVDSMIRYFPERDKSKIFSTSVAITTIFAVVFGIIFIIGIDVWSPELDFLNSWYAAIYLLVLAASSIISLTGGFSMAMRRAEFYFIQNILMGSKVFFLLPLVFLGVMGIFGAVGASCILAGSVMLYLLFRSGVSPVFTLDREFLHDTFYFSAGNYLHQLLINAPGLILPLMVLNVLGAEETAQYYIAYTIAVTLFLIPTAVSISLFVEGSHGETLRKSTLKSLAIIFSLLIPAALILYIFGGFILGIIGKSYVEALDLLRIIVLSSFFVTLVNVYFSIIKVQKNMKRLVFLSVLLFVLLIGLSYVFIPAFGIVGVGYAWLGGYGLCSLLIGVMIVMEGWI